MDDALIFDVSAGAEISGINLTFRVPAPRRSNTPLNPRIKDAYRDLDPGDVDAVLERAIVHLLRTPVVESAQIESDSVMYTYVDPSLESLSSAQRQLLRMGPRNQRRVQAELLPPEQRQD